ncbi:MULTISPECIES: hypothetical protein [Paucilactobacillus]|uniref:XRE family transcriptional regulator n=2 Tax=Paucilactobacillus hokkaidonensis TaxID=1193095 RepID=A0A0A1GVH2_9LACO|nr:MULTISPECIES: hypothetical protein [Paucilactobacillus]KRO07344.1 hypothetical protein IV59_GL001882 [Paucilactobacillus hokkaidonensis]BAP85990.1 hypothetical protein LOOC260_114540 [Paucilactobacillus hokkaidonensis JCM 18461]
MSTLEKRFKKRLIDKEMKQVEVARHFEWSDQYLRQLVTGTTMGPAAEKNLQKVKEYLGMK